MAEPDGRPIQPYGTTAERGLFECVDCGRQYVHDSNGSLPPCPRYRDFTHGRAAWRLVRRSGPGSGSEDDDGRNENNKPSNSSSGPDEGDDEHELESDPGGV